MNAAAKRALAAAAVAFGLATCAHAQSYSSPIHHYRHRQPVQRDFGAGMSGGQPYNQSPSYDYNPGYSGSDTAAALDE